MRPDGVAAAADALCADSSGPSAGAASWLFVAAESGGSEPRTVLLACVRAGRPPGLHDAVNAIITTAQGTDSEASNGNGRVLRGGGFTAADCIAHARRAIHENDGWICDGCEQDSPSGKPNKRRKLLDGYSAARLAADKRRRVA